MTDHEVTNLRRRFKVNVIHRGKERWRYPRTLEKAKAYRSEAILKGLSSIIYEKIEGKYKALKHYDHKPNPELLTP